MVRMGSVWDRTAEFLSENIAAILSIALVAFFIPASIEGNFATAGARLARGAAQLIVAIFSVWGTLAITAMALDTIPAKTAAGIALRRLPAVLLVSVAMLIAVMLLAAPIGVLLMRAGADFSAAQPMANLQLDGSTAGAIALYGLILFGALLWLAARLIIVTPVIVREHRLFGALARSWALTRGHALRIVGVLILYAIVSWVAYLAAQTVFGSIFALVAGGEGEGITLAGVLTAIVVAAVQTGFSVLAAAFTTKLYLALAAEVRLRNATPAA